MRTRKFTPGQASLWAHRRRNTSVSRATRPVIEAIESRVLLSATLTGTVIGTPGSYNNQGNTIAKAFDGNLSTYYDAANASGNYAGLDFGTSESITQISYAPRSGFESRMVGGVFQGSNAADFSSTVTLYTITAKPVAGKLTTVNSANTSLFKYVRYQSPNSSNGNVAELSFEGNAPASGVVVGSDGTLTVTGTSNADYISVDNTYNGLSVSLNGVVTVVSQPVNRLVVNALDGTDSVDVTNPNNARPNPSLPTFIDGGAGNDNITYRGDRQVTLNGGDGDDTLNVSATDTFLYVTMIGGNGNDSLNTISSSSAGFVYAQMSGGAGNDTFSNPDADDNVTISGGDGTDTLLLAQPPSDYQQDVIALDGQYHGGNFVVGADVENVSGSENTPSLQIIGNASANNIAVMNSVGPVTVMGLGGNDTLSGGGSGGPTSLYGGDGNDTFLANDGARTYIDGGTGTDTAYIDPTGDTVVNVEIVNPAPPSSTLTGTVIGTSGSYKNNGNTIAKAFDGNLSTFVDGPTSNGNFAGLDFGTSEIITQISYAPRAGYESRMVGGVFQGSNTPDFSSTVTLYTITATPVAGKLTTVNSANASPFEYVRYLSPYGSFGNVAEISFAGSAPSPGSSVGSDKTLSIAGTASADSIKVTFLNAAEANPQVQVSVNGVSKTYAAEAFGRIVINGNAGNDTITTNMDQQIVTSSAFAGVTLLINGNANDDRIMSDYNIYDEVNAITGETINGGDGNDYLEWTGTLSSNTPKILLHGNAGNDIIGSTGNSEVYQYGDEGDDDLSASGYNAGTQLVYMFGGAGNDYFSTDDPVNAIVCSGGDGTDTIELISDINTAGSLLSLGGTSHGSIQADATVENVEGGTNSDLEIDGNALNNSFNVYSSGNHITLIGGAGNDTFVPNAGTAYSFVGGSGNDTVDYSARTDNLNVYLDGSKLSGNAASPTDTFDGSVETVYGGSGNDLLVGTSANNALFGNDGNDTLISNGGTDALFGGNGNDSFQARDGGATYIDGGAGTDTAAIDSTGDTTVNVENVNFGSTPAVLTGTAIGTAGSYMNQGNTIAKVFDGSLSTFFDGPTANGNYVGLDLGSAKVVRQIKFAPRAGYQSRMVGGVFQGSNAADFSSATTLFTITQSPASGSFTTVTVSITTAFRFVRYLSPASSNGNIAELQFLG